MRRKLGLATDGTIGWESMMLKSHVRNLHLKDDTGRSKDEDG
jgi:hypothetical protein